MATQEVKIKIQENDIVRELVGQELLDYLAQRELDNKAAAEADLVAAQRAVDRAELLNRLGITADEAALLLS